MSVGAPSSAPGFTERVAEEVLAFKLSELPPVALERTRHAVLDWLGVAIAGSQEESGRIARGLVMADPGRPVASIVGTPDRASAQQATLVNAIAAHALDYDDSSSWAGGHPSAPIISSAVALGQARGASGSEIMLAIVAGMQGQARVALATGSSPYQNGFHGTGTFGTFGAAAACGRLLDLDVERMRCAFGLAATQAAGLKVSFGTMGKHLNAAKAGVNGSLAATLAARGFTAPLDAIEAHQGFEPTHSTTFDPGRPYAIMGDRLAIGSLLFKGHACCHGTHSAIEGAKRLRAEHDFEAGDVQHVRLLVPASLPDVCGISEPVTGLEGKFSIRYAITLALSDLPTGPSSFTDEMVHRPPLVDLRRRVEVEPTPEREAGAPTRVIIDLLGGVTLTAEVDVLEPAPDETLGLQWETLRTKFESLAAPVVGIDRALAQIDAVSHLEDVAQVDDLLERVPIPTR